MAGVTAAVVRPVRASARRRPHSPVRALPVLRRPLRPPPAGVGAWGRGHRRQSLRVEECRDVGLEGGRQAAVGAAQRPARSRRRCLELQELAPELLLPDLHAGARPHVFTGRRRRGDAGPRRRQPLPEPGLRRLIAHQRPHAIQREVRGRLRGQQPRLDGPQPLLPLAHAEHHLVRLAGPRGADTAPPRRRGVGRSPQRGRRQQEHEKAAAAVDAEPAEPFGESGRKFAKKLWAR